MFYLTSKLQQVTDSFFTRSAITCEHFLFKVISEDRPGLVNKNKLVEGLEIILKCVIIVIGV